MEKKTTDKPEYSNERSRILEVASYAAVIYLAMFFFGAAGEYFFGARIGSEGFMIFIGVFLLGMSPLFILWSQRSIRRFRKGITDELHIPVFNIGPYKLTRNPTYLGLAMLIAGFGFLANSLYIVLSAVAGFILVNIFVLPKEERLLEKKYGDIYLNYKRKVDRWL